MSGLAHKAPPVAPTPGAIAIAAEPRPKIADAGLRVAQNATALFVGRGLGLLFAAAANAILARYLGVEGLGQYGAIYAYLALFMWLATLGLQPVVTREAAARPGSSGSVIGTGVWLTLAASLPTLALALLFAPVARLSGPMLPLLFLAGIEIFVVPTLMVPGFMYQVEMEQWFTAGFGIVRQAIWLFAVIVLYLLGAPLLWIIVGRLLSAVVEGFLNWSGGRKRAKGTWQFDSQHAKSMVRHALPVSLSAFAFFIYLRIDQVMLHRMVSDYALGQYVAAVRISELTETFPSAIGFAIFPLLCASVASAEFAGYVSKMFRVLIFAGSCVCLIVFVLASPIIRGYYGVAFIGSVPLLRVLIWSELAVFFSAILNNALLARAREKLILVPTVSGAVLNVVLNLYWIPRYGALGACWATVVSYGISSTVMLLPFREARDVLTRGLRLLAPAVLALAASVFFADRYLGQTFAAAAVALAAFVICALLMRVFLLDDLRYAWQMYDRLRARSTPSATGS